MGTAAHIFELVMELQGKRKGVHSNMIQNGLSRIAALKKLKVCTFASKAKSPTIDNLIARKLSKAETKDLEHEHLFFTIKNNFYYKVLLKVPCISCFSA